ncbi:MAG: sulfite exporter TauE/SafE family protein [Chloroflexia bacterium]|nr:sulfite exporter TauE/SafE family protein [Chloroflexia bacterium]
MGTDVTILAAFLAGMLSISSPCVLPLVPIYLAHIAGATMDEPVDRTRQGVVLNAVSFVLGFSLIFVALGASLGAAGAMAGTFDVVARNDVWLVRLGGGLLILLGLHQVELVRIPGLNRERRLHTKWTSPGSLPSSFLVGVTFAAGWSPCVGPILGAIMTMAAGQGSIERATLLLGGYAAGLGVPFLLVALAFGSAPAVLSRLNGRLRMVTTVSGAVMLGVGAIMLLGIYQRIFAEIVRIAPWTPWEPTL